MKSTYQFAIGCAVFLLFISGIIFLTPSNGCATTATSIVISKPAKPLTVKVKTFPRIRHAEGVQQYIMECVKDGYIIKSVTGANDGEYDSDWIVVAEKY